MLSSSITDPGVVGRSGRCQRKATKRWCGPASSPVPWFVADRYRRLKFLGPESAAWGNWLYLP